MTVSLLTGFERLSADQAPELYRLLWSCTACTTCVTGTQCSNISCIRCRAPRLAHFIQHYNETCFSLGLELGDRCQSVVLHGHRSIFATIEALLGAVWRTRKDLRERLKNEVSIGRGSSDIEYDLVINAAVKITTMINCTSSSVTPQLLEQGQGQISWQDGETYLQFIEKTFSKSTFPILDQKLDESRGILYGRLAVRKVIKHAHITLKPTSDIRNHMTFDRRTNSLAIFLHTSFLKEQLRVTNGQKLSDAECLERGALPRQLVLEVLDSIQKVLFPLVEPRSKALLRSFVSKNSLDPDCLHFESTGLRGDHELNIAYHYFGNQLLDLYEVLRNPRPQRPFDKWLERRSGARYVMLATLAGIMLAILLGMASLAVTIFQTYLTYQAWKHPVH